jgi:hypothetical protein
VSPGAGKPVSPRSRAPFLLGLGLLAACSGDEDDPCRPLEPCDIRTSSCQERVFEATACMRDQEPRGRPRVRVMTLAQFEAALRAYLAERPPSEQDAWGTALGLLGLVDPSGDLDESQITTLVSQVAAFYEPGTGLVTIIDRGGSTDRTSDVLVLSHEYVHALQDQTVDLARFQRDWVDSTDTDVATSTVIEGEATVLSYAVIARMGGADPEQVAWGSLGSRIFEAMARNAEASPDPLLTAVQLCPYALGVPYVADAWLAEGQAGIDALYESPPRSTAEVLPADRDGFVPARVALDCYPTTAPAGYVGVDHDTFGVVGPFAFGVGDLTADDAWSLARRWRDDRIVVFAPPNPDAAPIAAAWRIRWADPADASAFAVLAEQRLQAAAGAAPFSRVVLEGDAVLLQVAADPVVLDGWTDAGCGTVGDLPAPPEADIRAAARTLGRARLRSELRR